MQVATLVPSRQLQLSKGKHVSSMNTQYEYKLPRGLGLRADGSVEDTDTASDVAILNRPRSSGRRTPNESFGAPSDSHFMQGRHGVRMQGSAGVRQSISTPCAVISGQELTAYAGCVVSLC